MALGIFWICRVSMLCRVFNYLHSVNGVVAECAIVGTQQTMKHSAMIDFPVVFGKT